MNILIISTNDRGGAGIAAVRLHKGLRMIGVNSKLLVLNKRDHQIPFSYDFKTHYLNKNVSFRIRHSIEKLKKK